MFIIKRQPIVLLVAGVRDLSRLLFLVFICAHFLNPMPALAQATDLEQLSIASEALSEELAVIDLAIERQTEQNARLLSQIDASDTGIADAATLADLRQAQFEVATVNTRLLTMEHQIEQQSNRIEELNQIIVRASAALRADESATLQRVVDEAALELRSNIRDTSASIYSRLVRLQALLRDNGSLRQEQLSIIQHAISLNAIEGYGSAGTGPLADRITRLVQSLSQSALKLSNAASAITGSNPAAIQRRNLLRLRSDELMLRSNARLTDGVIVEARDVVTALSRLSMEDAVPTRLFRDAIFALDTQEEALRSRMETTLASEKSATDLASILTDPERAGEGTQALAQQVARLSQLLGVQRQEVTQLLTRVEETRAELSRSSGMRERAALLQRDDIRLDPASRARIKDELLEIPSEVVSLYQARLAEIQTAFEVANSRTIAIFSAAVVTLIVLALALSWKILKSFVSWRGTRATAVPIEVLRRNIFWLVPLAIWAVFTQLFQISRETAIALYPLLAIPAAAALLRDLTSVIVSRRGSHAQRRIGFIITRAMEVAMVITAVVLFAYFLLAELPLLPSTASALNRLAFSVFVLAALPMLLFVFFFAAMPSSEHDAYSDASLSISPRAIVAALMSLFPPLALIATGVAGLAGYRELASLLLEQLATAIVIAAVTALALGILSDIKYGLYSSLREHDPSRAYAFQQNVLQPTFRLGQMAILVLAFIGAASVFGWTSETPVIKQALAGWNTQLFSLGGQAYTVGNLIIAALLLFIVFWFGAWCQRVTYSVLLRKVRDVGIRQSLSVFAQYVVIVLGMLLALSAIGFDVTTLTVFAASLGVGIGFGLQNVVNNFISGVLLLVERPLRIGDIVTVGGQSGTVSQIGIRSMRMRTFDEFDLVVPNSQLIAETFTNWTRSNSLMRVILGVGISYDDTPEEAVRIATEVLDGHPYVVRNPAPLVTVDEFGDNSVNLRVCYYVDLRGGMSGFVVRSEVLAGIWRAYREAGISIPFPQRDLHIIPSGSGNNAAEEIMQHVPDDGVVRSKAKRDGVRSDGDPGASSDDAIDELIPEN